MMNKQILCSFLLASVLIIESGLCMPLADEDYVGDQDMDTSSMKNPLNLITGPLTFEVKESESVELPCQVADQNPDDITLLWLNAMGITVAIGEQAFNREKYEVLPNGSLRVKNLNYNDTSYTCKVTNVQGQSLNVTHRIEIVSPAKVTNIIAKVDNPSKIIEPGTAVTLICNVTGYPKPMIKWSKRQTKSSKKELLKEGETISFPSINKDDSGYYECSAENSQNTQVSVAGYHLSVESEYGLTPVERVIRTGLGQQDVQLVCSVVKANNQIVWLKNGNQIPISNFKYTISFFDNLSTLTIKRIDNDNDFGDYVCKIRGNGDRTIDEAVVTLTGLPSAPEVTSVIPDTASHVTLFSWKLESYEEIDEYVVMYRKQEDSEWQSLTQTVERQSSKSYELKHEFSNLPSGVYAVICKAHNKHGWSDSSIEHTFSADEITSAETSSVLEPLKKADTGSYGNNLQASVILATFALFASFLRM